MAVERVPPRDAPQVDGLSQPTGPAGPRWNGPARAILAAAALATACQFLLTLKDARDYPGVDLRSRVVSARAFFQGLDPYYFEWRPEMSERLLYPLLPPAGPNGCTISPFSVLCYGPVSPLPWRAIRYASFALEWAALAASALLLVSALGPSGPRILLAGVAMAFFACSSSWRLHLERGQYYVFALLLLSAAAWLHARRGGDSLVLGLPLGLFLLMRPTALPLVLLLPLLRLRRAAISMAVTAVIGVGVTTAIGGAGTWPRFFRSSQEMMIGFLYPPYYRTLGPARGPQPVTVEGEDFSKMLPLRSEDVTLVGQIYGILDRRLPPEADRVNLLKTLTRVGQAAYGVVLLAFLLAAWSLAPGPPRHDLRLAIAVLAVLDADYLVALRNAYADVLLLAPLAILLPRLLTTPRSRAWLALVAFGLLSRLVFNASPAGDVLMSVFVTGTLNVFLLAEVLRERRAFRDGKTVGVRPAQRDTRQAAS